MTEDKNKEVRSEEENDISGEMLGEVMFAEERVSRGGKGEDFSNLPPGHPVRVQHERAEQQFYEEDDEYDIIDDDSQYFDKDVKKEENTPRRAEKAEDKKKGERRKAKERSEAKRRHAEEYMGECADLALGFNRTVDESVMGLDSLLKETSDMEEKFKYSRKYRSRLINTQRRLNMAKRCLLDARIGILRTPEDN